MTALQSQPAAPVEHPIIFSGPMIRAILAGKKTQTRRLVKVPPKSFPGADLTKAYADKAYGVTPCLQVPCADESVQRLRNPWDFPRSTFTIGGVIQQPTHLWVRETFALSLHDPETPNPSASNPSHWDTPVYGADNNEGGEWLSAAGKPIAPPWRPSIHMPRWASRITLEVTDVRAERLQDISTADAMAEGIPQTASEAHALGLFDMEREPSHEWDNRTSVENFTRLWDSINGARDRADWAANPWVWCVAFRVLP